MFIKLIIITAVLAVFYVTMIIVTLWKMNKYFPENLD